MKKPKDIVVVITKTYTTRAYYRMGGGGCRRLEVDARGRVIEYPRYREAATRCRLPGKHPHKNREFRGRRRRTRTNARPKKWGRL